MRRIAIAFALISVVAACSGSDEPVASVDPGEHGPGPTHDYEMTEEALLEGVLHGTVDCLWIGDAEATATPLVLPPGTRARDADGGALEIYSEGSWAVRTGDRVAVTGGYDGAWPNCLDNSEVPFVSGYLQSCSETECDDPEAVVAPTPSG